MRRMVTKTDSETAVLEFSGQGCMRILRLCTSCYFFIQRSGKQHADQSNSCLDLEHVSTNKAGAETLLHVNRPYARH